MEAELPSAVTQAPRRIGVLLAGVGGVGQAFARVLQQRFCTTKLHLRILAIGDSEGFVAAAPSIYQHGLDWDDVVAILDHKKRGHAVPSWTSDRSSSEILVFDGLVSAVQHFHGLHELDDCVVADCTSTRAIVPSLLKAKELGFAIVLANKLPVGGSFEHYQQLTHHANGRVRYEATVGAGLPVISVLHRIVASQDSIKMIRGGLSGTMTYILSAMNQGASFSVALQEVRKLGITENDPREDLSGADVARKMVILARELGLAAETSDVEIVPLLPKGAFELPVNEFMHSLHTYDDEFNARLLSAKSQGCALAYIGTVYSDGRICIGLEHVSPTSLFATASSTEGVISISSEWFPEPLMLRGTGAGAESTAAAVAGDLAAIIYRHV